MDGRKEYRAWVVDEISKNTYCTVVEAFDKANKWMESPRFEDSYARWSELNRDIILFSNPAEHVKFPNV
tara:strand:+ start:213 stop:419 length:207 start_codon:yes stop_codon:yes gene_type:complete